MKKSVLFALLLSAAAFADEVEVKSKKSTANKAAVSAVEKDADKFKSRASSATSPAVSSTDLKGSAAGKAVKGLKVRPIVGYNFFNPKGLNNFLDKTYSNTFNKLQIKGGTSFALAADYPLDVLARGLTAGLRLEYFVANSENVTVGTRQAGAALQAGMAGLPIMATVGYSAPVHEKVNVGGWVGGGVPAFYRAYVEVSDSTLPGMPNGTLNYNAIPFTAMLAAYSEYVFDSRFAVRFEAGYRFLSSENMKLTDSYSNKKAGEVLNDPSTTNVRVDASSFNTMASLVVTL